MAAGLLQSKLPSVCLSTDPNLLSAEQADWLSTLFDVGGIIGEH